MRAVLGLLAAVIASLRAWNAAGHLVVAEIARQQLLERSPGTLAAAEELLRAMPSAAAEDGQLFLESAVWADRVAYLSGWRAFAAWHYRDLYHAPDGREVKLPAPPEHVVWALRRCAETLRARDSGVDGRVAKAFMLRFLLHLVGDVHQPLHNASLVDDRFPAGDRGGNAFAVKSRLGHSLHALWDAGVGELTAVDVPLTAEGLAYVQAKARQLAAETPRPPPDSDFETWSLAAHRLAVEAAYADIAPGETPSPAYLLRGAEVCRRQLVLAGYRLADALEQLVGAPLPPV